MQNCFITGRYHSWVVSFDNFPYESLNITAVDIAMHIMAIKHKHYNVRGVQFHPESYITQNGLKIMKNWLEI
jgi:anthranilate synthase component 2